MRRQGVHASELIAGAARPGVTPDPREAHFHHQRLAQVLWEEQLGAMDTPHAAINPVQREARPPAEEHPAEFIRAHELKERQSHFEKQWKEKERVVNAKRGAREQMLQEVSNKWCQKHVDEACRATAFKEEMQKQREQRRYEHYRRDHQRGIATVKKLSGVRHEHAEGKNVIFVAKADEVRMSKAMHMEEEDELLRLKCAVTSQKSSDAGVRRQRALSARSTGRPSLHVNREIARMQADRFTRLQAEKRLAWYDALENNRSPAAGGVPVALLDRAP